MAYFPLFVELKNVPCLVVGGSGTAAKKAEMLLSFGAEVTVVSKTFCKEFEAIQGCKKIQKAFSKKQLKGMEMVIAATGDVELDHEIAELCSKKGIMVNSTTSKEDSFFLFPAVVRKEGMTIGITSGGKNAAATGLIAERIDHCIPENFDIRVNELELLREWLKRSIENSELRKRIFYELMEISLDQGISITQDVVNSVISKVLKGEN